MGKRNARACKAAVKAVEKDDALKKPLSAYWMWLNDNREQISKMVGGHAPAVAKKGGEMWKALSDAGRSPYEKKAKEEKEKYDKFIASDEGQKALQAFKDAKNEAKEQFKPKEDPDAEATEKDAGCKKARGMPAKVQAATLGA